MLGGRYSAMPTEPNHNPANCTFCSGLPNQQTRLAAQRDKKVVYGIGNRPPTHVYITVSKRVIDPVPFQRACRSLYDDTGLTITLFPTIAMEAPPASVLDFVRRDPILIATRLRPPTAMSMSALAIHHHSRNDQSTSRLLLRKLGRYNSDMALRDIDEGGGTHDVVRLAHQRDFDRTWLAIPAPARAAIEAEINRRLDELITSPDRQWGSITNTSIEGGQTNPITRIRGDWSGTVYDPIFEACGRNEELAGMFFGNVWKKVIIARPERWIGVRLDPTFPQRGITLQGKSYFPDTSL